MLRSAATSLYLVSRAPDKVHIFISIIPISSPNPMFDHLFQQDNSNKWSKIGFNEQLMQVVLI